MSKPRRNKALQVLDGRLELARQQHMAAVAEADARASQVQALMDAREQVARAYERPKAGRPAGKRNVAAVLVKPTPPASPASPASPVPTVNAREGNDV